MEQPKPERATITEREIKQQFQWPITAIRTMLPLPVGRMVSKAGAYHDLYDLETIKALTDSPQVQNLITGNRGPDCKGNGNARG